MSDCETLKTYEIERNFMKDGEKNRKNGMVQYKTNCTNRAVLVFLLKKGSPSDIGTVV